MTSFAVRRLPAVAAVLAVTLAAAGCSGGGTKKAAGAGDTAPGVTADTITVGTVADLSGVIPGLFQGAVNGAKAYADYVNSTGGINGKKLAVTSADSGTTCTGAKQAAQQLNGHVLAYVGSFTIYDGCAAAVWQQTGAPVFMYPLSSQVKKLPNLYSPEPSPPGFYTGPQRYLSKQHPGTLKHVAIIYGDQAQESYKQLRGMYDSLGAKVLYTRGVSPTETNYTADIVAMRNKGVQWLDMTGNDLGTIVRVLGAAAQQHWKPQVLITTPAYDPNAFNGKSMDLLESEGALMTMPFAMFQGEDATTVPAVAQFDKWYATESKGSKPDLFALYGWTSMALFTESLKAVDGSVTRASLLQAVQGVHQFDADGLLPVSDVGAKKPPGCWLFVVVKNGKFVRVPPSPTDGGFICDNAPYFYYKG